MSGASTANYGGRQPNTTAYVKYFIPGYINLKDLYLI
jgi:hypothetical protein